MEVIKTLWLKHSKVGAGGKKSGQESSIFSMSIDPQHSRLATTGLDTTCRLWNLKESENRAESALSGVQPTNQIKDRHILLGVLGRHTGAVLAVDWSPECVGSLLATGADDALVLVWEQRSDASLVNSAFEGNGEMRTDLESKMDAKNIHKSSEKDNSTESGSHRESWTVLHRLVGHGSDVNGIAWSPDGKWLASCSLDGSVLIWSCSQSFTLAQTLATNPNKPLKGLSWDPLGQYIIAQSNDGHVFIWRVRGSASDWALAHVLSPPFCKSYESYTYFSRPSWSPDGRFICISDCFNQNEAVALLMSRDLWSCEQSFVGHCSSVQITQFCPILFKSLEIGDSCDIAEGTKNGGATDATHPYCMLIAMGSQDGSLSIWRSDGFKPVAVIASLFPHAIMDICWSTPGNVQDTDGQSSDAISLYTCSYDGSIAMVRIDTQALNLKPYAANEQREQLAMLGQDLVHGNATSNLPTSHATLKLQEKYQKANRFDGDVDGNAKVTKGGREKEEVGNAAMPATAASSKQTQTVLKSGKRRITPQLLQQTPTKTSNADKAAEESEMVSIVVGKSALTPWLTPISSNAPTQMTIVTGESNEMADSDSTNRHIYISNNKSGHYTSIKHQAGHRDGVEQPPSLLWSKTLQDPQINILAATFCPRSRLLALATSNQQLCIWSSTSAKPVIPPILLDSNITCMACAGGFLVAVVETGTFYVWRVGGDGRVQIAATAQLPTQNLYNKISTIDIYNHASCEAGGDEAACQKGAPALHKSRHCKQNCDLAVEFCFAKGRSLIWSRCHGAFFAGCDSDHIDALIAHVWGPQTRQITETSQLLTHLQQSLTIAASIQERSLEHAEHQFAIARILGDHVRALPWILLIAKRCAESSSYGRALELLEEDLCEACYGGESVFEMVKYLFGSSPCALVRSLAERDAMHRVRE